MLNFLSSVIVGHRRSAPYGERTRRTHIRWRQAGSVVVEGQSDVFVSPTITCVVTWTDGEGLGRGPQCV